MPPCRCRDDKKPKQTAEDRISALPDELLHRVLYFLPPCDMARTSVLSPRWRTVWKSMTALRITGAGRSGSAADFNTVVNNLLLFRDRAPLLEFELCTYYHADMMSGEFEDIEEVERYLDMWIRHALMCKVPVLKVVGMSLPECIVLVNGPLISEDLRILKLWSVSLG